MLTAQNLTEAWNQAKFMARIEARKRITEARQSKGTESRKTFPRDIVFGCKRQIRDFLEILQERLRMASEEVKGDFEQTVLTTTSSLVKEMSSAPVLWGVHVFGDDVVHPKVFIELRLRTSVIDTVLQRIDIQTVVPDRCESIRHALAEAGLYLALFEAVAKQFGKMIVGESSWAQYPQRKVPQVATYECRGDDIIPLLVELGFHPWEGARGHSEKDVYDWWEASNQTQDLLPGLGWECWVFHYRGVIWVCCHGGSNSEALVEEVSTLLVELCGARPLPDTDPRRHLRPRNQVGMLGVEGYKHAWEQAEKAAKASESHGEDSPRPI